MRTVGLVSRDATLSPRARRALEGAFEVIAFESLGLALEAASSLPVDLLVVDFGSARVDTDDLATLRARHPQAFLVGLLSPGEPAAPGVERCDLTLPGDAPDSLFRASLEQALRFQRLAHEVSSLRRERARQETSPLAEPPGRPSRGALGNVLKEMGKLLAAHFDLERVVDFFLDAITELVRPGRVALLLDDDGRYRIWGQRGLDPALGQHLRLNPAEGLPDWFRRHARPAVLVELGREPEWLDAARELQALGGELAVPLWVQAKLVGILALGQRVTGQPYTGEDLERLFTLASQVAIVVEDISLFNTVRAQHNFIEQVLAHLQSGAITIDAAGRVTLFNRRAEEILGVPRSQVLGQDLRALPSPLGDLLFDTLQGGRELRLQEVALPRRPTFTLEVSTSRIVSPTGATAGAVMIIDDPTPRHLLQRERQTTQTLDLLNRVLLRLTDEIKNPLVSIYTFLELLPQRYDDPEFRETFFSVVGRDTQHLISLVDKLITLAGEREYKVDFCDMRDLLNDALEDLAIRFERPKAAQDAAIFLLQPPDRNDRLTAVLYTSDTDLVVKADRDQLGKALGYLIRFLMNRVEGNGRVAIHALPDPDEPRTVRLSILGKPATLSLADRERLFSPLAIASERLLDVGPSVSQKIVEAHGGTLTVGGEEGEIRFVLTLPRTSR
ncbi:MAG: GAF domain-containing protein [Candidatus Rokubacteria bacterium]|nr:GAF domain-containing protein [Candidatus Rokubacteria bacterium]